MTETSKFDHFFANYLPSLIVKFFFENQSISGKDMNMLCFSLTHDEYAESVSE